MLTDAEAMLMQQEGLRLKVYPDIKGVETIGVGRNLRNKGISHEEAMMMFHNDLADSIDAVRHCCSIYDQLSRPRQLVLISLAYNLGREGLGKFVRFIGAVHLGNWEEAADELKNSKAARDDPHRYIPLIYMMRTNISQWV